MFSRLRGFVTTSVWSRSRGIASLMVRSSTSIRHHATSTSHRGHNNTGTKGKTMSLVETMRHTLDNDTSLLKSDSWDQLWQQGVTPWDLHMPTPVLQVELEDQFQPTASSPMTALVPGCGSGFDLITLAQILPRDSLIVGLDISLTSLQRAQAVLMEAADAAVGSTNATSANTNKVLLAQGDFFDRTTWKPLFSTDTIQDDATSCTAGPPTTMTTIPTSFDFIYDYVFYCALPPSLRPGWGAAVAWYLKPPTGRLLTVIFPILPNANPTQGPPFPVTVQDYRQVLEPLGIILEHPPHDSPHTVPSRMGKEVVAWWKHQHDDNKNAGAPRSGKL